MRMDGKVMGAERESPYLSIVVITNNHDVLDGILIRSLDEQRYTDYELIIVDTIQERFTSASAAMNAGLAKCHGDVVLFLHHDISFNSSNALGDVMKELDALNHGYALLGFAGVVEGEYGKSFRMNIQCGEDRTGPDHPMKEMEPCFAVDECGFALKRSIIEKYGFYDLGDTWHLYAVELCLRLKKDGYQVGVIPADVWHHSYGDTNVDYYNKLWKLCRIYRKDFDTIYTCCAVTKTRGLMPLLKLCNVSFVHEAKRTIKKMIRWKGQK